MNTSFFSRVDEFLYFIREVFGETLYQKHLTVFQSNFTKECFFVVQYVKRNRL